eukprot:EG_transcript_16854
MFTKKNTPPRFVTAPHECQAIPDGALPTRCRLVNNSLAENVPEFDGSRSQAAVLQVLAECGYAWHHIHFCPTQLSIPNERRRYYLLATHGPLFRIEQPGQGVARQWPMMVVSPQGTNL